MSLLSLPEELLDLVFDSVANDIEVPVDYESLSALCLVSKALLPAARRALYYEPHDYPDIDDRDWEKGRILLASLQANGGALGRLVRDLDGISWHWKYRLYGSEACEHGVIEEQAGVIVEWYIAMLAACPLLQKVELVLPSALVVDRIFDALLPSLPTLKKIELSYCDLSHLFPSVTAQQVFEAFKRYITVPLDSLFFNGTSSIEQIDSTGRSPQLPIVPRKLKIFGGGESFDRVFPLLPAPASSGTLKEFSYGNYRLDVTDAEGLYQLSTALGRGLRKLHLCFLGEGSSPLVSLADARAIDAFSLFPHLVSLSLQGFYDINKGFLPSLFAHSPRLVNVDLEYSLWSKTIAKNRTTLEDRLFRFLLHFPRLRYCHLGLFPVKFGLKGRPNVFGVERQNLVIEYNTED